MGRKTQTKKQPSPAETAMSRAESANILHQDDKRASEGGEAAASSASCDLGPSRQQTRPYLSYEQLASLEPTTKVNLDVSHLVGKDCRIFSDVSHIVGCVHAFKSRQHSMSQKEMDQTRRRLTRMIKQQEPEELFQRMNCGTEADLLEWQQFSFLCFGSVTHQYALYGIPLRVWVDDDVLPPAKRIARERARLNVQLHMTQKANNLMDMMTKEVARLTTDPAGNLHELGDDDVVVLDMEEFTGRKLVMPIATAAVRFLYNMWHPLMARPASRTAFTAIYKERLTQLQDSEPDSDNHSTTLMTNCVAVAVLARLLFDKPIRVQQTETDIEHDSVEYSTDDCLPGMVLVPDPSPEMLCSIVIPDSVAAKGGYVVAGEFRPDHGIETVHLKFSDFNQDDTIILHQGNEVETHLLLLSQLSNSDFIDGLIDCKKASDKETREHMTEWANTLLSLPDDPLFVHEVQLGGLDAYEQLQEVYQHRMLLPPFRQALYGTPARLFYTSEHSTFYDDPGMLEYLNHVREICVKKLGEGSGTCGMKG